MRTEAGSNESDAKFQTHGCSSHRTRSRLCQALLDEAATLFLSGEPDAARLILRDLVNATVGFEQLAELTHKRARASTECSRRRQPEHGQPRRHIRRGTEPAQRQHRSARHRGRIALDTPRRSAFMRTSVAPDSSGHSCNRKTKPIHQQSRRLHSSTRRFRARPSSASLPATGASGPTP